MGNDIWTVKYCTGRYRGMICQLLHKLEMGHRSDTCPHSLHMTADIYDIVNILTEHWK